MWLQTLSALLIVLGLLWALRVALRGLGIAPVAGARRSLRVAESCALGGKQRLWVVEVDGERMLLGTAEGSVRLIRRLAPAPACEAEPEAEAAPAGAPRWLATARDVLRHAGIASVVALVLLVADGAAAQSLAGSAGEGGSSLTLSLDGATDPERISTTVQILILMTVMSVAPSLLLVATSFTRIVIVLSLLRQAMGIHQLPPNQIIVGLALFTTFFVMAPVGAEIKETAFDPYVAEEIGEEALVANALGPVRAFMTRHTRQTDLGLFASLSDTEIPEDPEEISFVALLPAFMISEIRTAFEIGFMIYLPFLIVDIVVASMLISMGMIVLPPIIISLPFKLMLFVLLDGWNLVISALVAGIR